MISTWLPDVSPDTPFSLANIPFGIVSFKMAALAVAPLGKEIVSRNVLRADHVVVV